MCARLLKLLSGILCGSSVKKVHILHCFVTFSIRTDSVDYNEPLITLTWYSSSSSARQYPAPSCFVYSGQRSRSQYLSVGL